MICFMFYFSSNNIRGIKSEKNEVVSLGSTCGGEGDYLQDFGGLI